MFTKLKVMPWIRILFLGVFCMFLFGDTSVQSSNELLSSKSVDVSKYYVAIKDRGIKLIVGTQVAELVKSADLLAIQVGVRNSSGKRIEVAKEDFKLLNSKGEEVARASSVEVDNARKMFNRRLRRFTKVNDELGTMFPKLPSDFYPTTGQIQFPTVSLPTNYKMVDFLYFKDSFQNGPYTLIWQCRNFEEPFTVDFDFNVK